MLRLFRFLAALLALAAACVGFAVQPSWDPLGLSERGGWTLVWRFTGQPEWMLNHHFNGQANWMIFLSALLYLVAPGNETGEVPIKNWWLVGVVLAVASFSAGVVFTALVLQPATLGSS